MKTLIEFSPEEIEAGIKHMSSNTRPSGPLFVEGLGIKVYDKRGKEFFDLSSQTLNMNLGHSHPVTKQVAQYFAANNTPNFLSSRLTNPYSVLLAKKLAETAPNGLNIVNLKLTNGSDANEDAMKRTRKYHEGNGSTIVSLYRSHLGETSETITASGKNFHNRYYVGGSGKFLFIDPVYTFRRQSQLSEEEHIDQCIDQFKSLLKRREDIVGIIMELIQVDGGVLVQPKRFVQKIEELCRQNNKTFIVDEVQTAFGWTGEIFLSNSYGITPDIISLGKGIACGIHPLAATVFKDKFDNIGYGISECTHGALPQACATALFNISYLQNSGVLNSVNDKGKHFMKRLQNIKAKHSQIGDVRGLGLILGLEFVKSNGREDCELTDRVYSAALEERILLRKATCGGSGNNVLIIKPPIIITHKEIDDSIDLLENSLEKALK